MEYHDGLMRLFGVTSTLKVLFHSLCFTAVCIHYAAEGRALSQASDLSKPTIYIDIPRWEDRTAYPRFLIYRDQLRRRLESRDTADSQVVSYSKSANSNSTSGSDTSDNDSAIINVGSQERHAVEESVTLSEEADNSNEFSSLEQLLAEQRGSGVIPPANVKLSNANNTNNIPNEPPTVPNNFMSTPDAHDKEIINFPRDKTNPCNRLQINLDEENGEQQSKSNESRQVTDSPNPSSKEEDVSFEIGDRKNFPSKQETKPVEINDATMDLIRDVVPTFQLTMSIIQQSRWNDENVVFSPLSIANVLSMLLLGAGGSTFKELSLQLGKHKNLATSSATETWDVYRYHGAFKLLLEYLRKNSGDGVALNSASEIFVDKRFPISKKFQHELLNYYEAPSESFNFGKDGYVFMDKLNKWVSEKTRNQIQIILEEPPSPETAMGIINAIYFKGPWESPFSEKLTRWRDFHVQPKEKMKAQLMISILTIPYVDRSLYRMTAVPYKGNKTALFLILPKGNDGLNDIKNVERSLTRQELNESIASMTEMKIALTLPKLKFSSDGEMARILQNMGLSSVFSANKANFSAISSEGLYISRLLHRAVVEINEKGTEASAVTLGTADRIIDDLPISFGCDKPFLFFIYHVEADTILFWGRVIRPDT